MRVIVLIFFGLATFIFEQNLSGSCICKYFKARAQHRREHREAAIRKAEVMARENELYQHLKKESKSLNQASRLSLPLSAFARRLSAQLRLKQQKARDLLAREQNLLQQLPIGFDLDQLDDDQEEDLDHLQSYHSTPPHSLGPFFGRNRIHPISDEFRDDEEIQKIRQLQQRPALSVRMQHEAKLEKERIKHLFFLTSKALFYIQREIKNLKTRIARMEIYLTDKPGPDG